MNVLKVLTAAVMFVALSSAPSCGGSPTSPSACLAGPYTFDSNPSVNRCRDRQGQFANSSCCGR
jgi:hypothetical protein